MRLMWAGLTVLSLLGAPGVAVAQDYEAANLEFFYPIVPRRPVIPLGPFDLIGEVSYNWTFKPEHAQEFDSGLAAAWPVSRWFTPFVELRTTTPTVAEDRRTQVTLVPGLNVKPFPRSTLAVGVQLPVTNAREFDYQVRVLFIKEF